MSQITSVLPILMIPKEMNVQLGYNLHHYEFACKCTFDDCTYTLISQELIAGWNAMRKTVNNPMRINSGYRCQKHNSRPEIKGVPTSRHKSGHAIDVYIGALKAEEKVRVIEIAKNFFDVVIVYETFIHCHMEPDTHKRIFIGHFNEQVSS